MPKSSAESSGFVKVRAEDQKYVEPAGGSPVVYSNAAQVFLSNEDVCISFGTRDPGDPTTVNITTRLYMSHSHAKRLVGALASSISQLEEMLGRKIESNPGASAIEAKFGDTDE